MKSCKACGEKRRVLKRAFVLTMAGLEPGLVCRECERGAVTIVASRAAIASSPAASTMAPLEVKAFAKDIVRQLRGLRRVCDDDHRAEGLDQAIGLLLAPEARAS